MNSISQGTVKSYKLVFNNFQDIHQSQCPDLEVFVLVLFVSFLRICQSMLALSK